jgi:hypothetical protein
VYDLLGDIPTHQCLVVPKQFGCMHTVGWKCSINNISVEEQGMGSSRAVPNVQIYFLIQTPVALQPGGSTWAQDRCSNGDSNIATIVAVFVGVQLCWLCCDLSLLAVRRPLSNQGLLSTVACSCNLLL